MIFTLKSDKFLEFIYKLYGGIKIKTLNILLGLILALAIVPVAMAQTEFGNVISGGKLLVTDVDAKVGSKTSKNLDFGDKIIDGHLFDKAGKKVLC